MRVTLGITQPLAPNTLGVSALGVFSNPNKDVHSLYLSPLSLVHKPGKWCELWLGLFCYYNDKSDEDDSVDIRPRVGAKLFLPNAWKWNLYNFTRFEYRFLQDLGSGDHEEIPRLRNRTGLEAPLSFAHAWQPGSHYAIADVEPYYRLDDAELEFVRGRVGLGRVLNPRWRVEVLYHRQFSRGDDGDFERNDNIWRLNLKLNLGAPGRARGEPDPDADPH